MNPEDVTRALQLALCMPESTDKETIAGNAWLDAQEDTDR